LVELGIGFGNWLASISWWKFCLLSILLLIFGGITSSIIFSDSPGSGRVTESGTVTVDVHVVPLADGRLLIDSAAPPAKTPRSLSSPARNSGAKDDGVLLQIDGDGSPDSPAVRIDKQGVRVLADDSGHKVAVVIDHNGVRVEKLPGDAATGSSLPAPAVPVPPVARGAPMVANPPGSPALPPIARLDPSVAGLTGPRILLPDVDTDPEKIAAAVEAARDQIENVVQDQVDNKLEALNRDGQVENKNWVGLLVSLIIVALIALKVALGSKSRAEFQARQASATAAQEGLKRQLAEAQLKMMQAQVEPHFLFNTLASVDYLIETDPARASRMQKNLIQYLRAAVPQMREGTSNLGREILQCRSYLEILKVRMDERLQFSINVPQGLLSAAFPPMMLLTLVENAIKHGLEPKPEGGTLSVAAVVADGKLRVAVADSGMGFGIAQRGGTGVGLVNVRERLQALYGTGAGLSIDANSDGGTIATILVPYRIEPAAGAAPAAGFAAPAAAV
jgi:signal transduction histidine kinase